MMRLNKLEICNNLITDHLYKNPDIKLTYYEYGINTSNCHIIFEIKNNTYISIINRIATNDVGTMYTQINEVDLEFDLNKVRKKEGMNDITLSLPDTLSDLVYILLPVKTDEWIIEDFISSIKIHSGRNIRIHLKNDTANYNKLVIKLAVYVDNLNLKEKEN